MNEDIVGLIIGEKCVYRIRILKRGSGIISKYLFKRYFLVMILITSHLSGLNAFPIFLALLGQSDGPGNQFGVKTVRYIIVPSANSLILLCMDDGARHVVLCTG